MSDTATGPSRPASVLRIVFAAAFGALTFGFVALMLMPAVIPMPWVARVIFFVPGVAAGAVITLLAQPSQFASFGIFVAVLAVALVAYETEWSTMGAVLEGALGVGAGALMAWPRTPRERAS